MTMNNDTRRALCVTQSWASLIDSLIGESFDDGRFNEADYLILNSAVESMAKWLEFARKAQFDKEAE